MVKPTVSQYEKDTIFLPNEHSYLVRKSINTPSRNALHYHDHYEMMLPLSGKLLYTVAGQHYWLIPGTILVIPPWQLHKPLKQGKEMAERLVVRFSRSYLNCFSKKQKDFSRGFEEKFSTENRLLYLNSEENQEVFRILNSLYEEDKGSLFGKEIAVQTWMVQLILMMSRITNQEAPQKNKDPETVIIQKAVDYIEHSFHKNITIESLANKFYVDRYSFSKSFSKITGTPPSRYILQRRLLEAQRLLARNVPAQQTALETGFNDYSNFYRQFYTMYGVSPSEFREKNAK